MPDLRALAFNERQRGVLMSAQALTFEQLKLFNQHRPRKILCLIKHRMFPVGKPLPIRVGGKIKRFPINRCVRCGFAEITK